MQSRGKKARFSKPVRPVDKELKFVNQTITTSVTSTVLKTTTFPGTVVGLRWDFGAVAITAAEQTVAWLIVVIPDGEAANTPAISDGADLYTPEQNVMAFGAARLRANDSGGGSSTIHVSGSTKTMRKLKQGDVLAFITFGAVANGTDLDGCVQFFFKT